MAKILILILIVFFSSFAVAFTPSVHKEVTGQAIVVMHEGKIVQRLMKISTLGDEGESWFEDASHFDNCAWYESLAWMKKYHKKAVQSAISYRKDGYEEEERIEVFNSLGYVIHTSEDFYSHSNWIETHEIGDFAKLGVNSIVKPSNWFSGIVNNDPSNRCPKGTPHHDTMNKDKSTTVGFDEARTDAIMEVQFQLKKFAKGLVLADGVKNARETLSKLGLYTKKSRFTSAMMSPLNSKIYFFKKNNRYSRYDFLTQKKDYTVDITEFWKGLTPIVSDIQASFVASNDKVYFFSKNDYIRYDIKKDKADEGYPKTIKYGWQSVWYSNIDAIVQYPNSSKVYIFKAGEYVRFDFVKNRVDRGYPRLISRYWRGLDPFSEGIDAAVLSPKKDKIFFFKNDRYISYDIKKDKADGTPKLISGDWKGL